MSGSVEASLAVTAVRDDLAPRLSALVLTLEQEGAAQAADFFRSARQRLLAARDEGDLVLLFVEHLSASAFVIAGEVVSQQVLERLDGLLCAAEQYAATFSADGPAH